MDDWAGGVHNILITVFPFLLRDHPQVEKVRDLLRSKSDTYERLEQNPASATEYDLPLAAYEPGKMLYRLLALHGVWPGVDAKESVQQALERARKK